MIYAQNGQFVPRSKGGSCCCGQFVELFYSNLDFEDAPSPPPGGLILYSAGEFFSGWTCTRATIDHKDALFGNLTLGNPNGRSNFIDLHGSPGFGAIEYNLTGLTPGNMYRIDFWTAQNGSGYTSTGTLRIAGGAWLNVNWLVTTDGSIFWFKESHMFMATATSASMEFSSVGGSEWGGTLIDDIKIFECPGDLELPQVNNPQEDLDIDCEKDIPKAAKLNVIDNCDPSLDIVLKETIEIIDPCNKILTRTWEVKDDCGNVTIEDQIITVSDKIPPDFIRAPQDKIVYCTEDVPKLFNDWIKRNADATAIDNCGIVSWRTSIDHTPVKSCDSILVEFIAVDYCGQERSGLANFYVLDTTAPDIVKEAENKSFYCNPYAKDSLKNWLNNHGFAEAKDNCDTTIWSNNFDGDSSKNDITIWFYAKDLCGNKDSTTASFISRNSSDTFLVVVNSCTAPTSSLDTLVYTINGCDSVVIVNTRRIASDTILLQSNTCDPNHSKFDSMYLLNAFGCDSLVIQEFILRPITITTLRDSFCTVQNVYADTLIFPGQYCDSIVIVEHYPLRSDSVIIHKTTCDSLQQGLMKLHLTNQFNCDSIVSITTEYTAQTSTFISLQECGLSNYYIDTIIYSMQLCDSLLITEHKPLRTDSVFLQSHICEPTLVGLFTSQLTNIFGCDSIIVLERLLDPSDSLYLNRFSCISSEVGLNKKNFKNQYGCDSIVVTETFLIPGDSTTIQNFTCKLQEAGTTRVILQNKNGCDSTIIMEKIFQPSDTVYLTSTTCIGSQQRKDTLVYPSKICDSIVIETILFIPSDTSYEKISTCLQTEAGLDSILLKNTKACDSLIYINRTFVPLELHFQVDSISCYGKNDGAFQILNTQDFKKPFEVILNNQTLSNTTAITNMSAGNYLIFIRDHKGCVTDTVSISLVEPNELITDLGNDLEVSKGSKVELNLQTNRNLLSINWFPTNFTNCSNCTAIDFRAANDLWIYTLAIDERNCVSRDSIFIRVKKSGFVYAPNAISANGDNINDYFYLIADDLAEIELLQIYDRWGEKVFETQHISPNQAELGWNGIFNSQMMNPGVYLYYAKVKLGDGSEHILKGDFTLIR